MVGYVCHRVTPRDTFTSLGLIRDSFGKEVDSNVNGTVRVIQHPLYGRDGYIWWIGQI